MVYNMESVLISLWPQRCKLVTSGKKTVVIRKTKPKLETPFKVYIYCTLPPKEELFTHGCIREYANGLIRLQDGQIVYDYGMRLCCDIENRPYSQDNFLCRKVIGEFVCDKIIELAPINRADEDIEKQACLSREQIVEYLRGKGCAWHISDLVIYDKPKELSEFMVECNGIGKEKSCFKCDYYRFIKDHNSPFVGSGQYNMKCVYNYLRPLKSPPKSWRYVVVKG